MAGIGKTTLAREIFEDLDIIEWFECRVWVTAGFEWREGRERTSEEITEDILAQVDPELHKMVMGGSEEEKSEAWKESLKGLEVSGKNTIDVRLLDKKESWDLLQEKAFVGVSCPSHLEEAGKKIAEKCDGLPLTIVTIADFLSKAPESLWIDVATKRKHELFVDAYDQISQVLNPSYEILDDDIKNNFLYMGAFPLKYLALTCNGNLHSSISDLRKLQYLIVHFHLSIKPFGALFHLPMEIWDMKRLKHLQVKGYDLPNVGDTFLQELITLSDVTTRSCMVLNRVPNLKKLGIKIELAPNATDPLSCFDHISHLTKLKSLRCVIVNPFFKIGAVSPILSFTCFSFSLKKLSLSGMGYPWEEMSKIASLPKLKMLKLRNNAFRGPE
ncbi:hypothetical protein ACS0TY_025982 [Phlomoides rotata]